MTYVERLHTWLADHLSWVQYPHISPFQRRYPFFKTAMPWPTRVGLVLFGVLAMAVLVAALLFLGLLAWALLAA